MDFQTLQFPYRRHADQDAAEPARHPVVVVGAGPVGLALAIDLAQRNVPVVVLDNDHQLSVGSRAICFAKRTLEIFDRLGCGQPMVDKGVSWNVGRVFLRDEPVYAFNLLPEAGHERPAFINLQQYYVEGYLAERAAQLPLIDLRWDNAVSAIEQQADHALLTVDTPDGPYRLRADWVAACDGSRSTVRELIGQSSTGRVFKDRFLIADVKITGRQQPPERWFWFDPPFHPGQSVLLHRQPDDVWRIDFQLGWEADPDEAKKPENIVPLVRRLLGPDVPFTLEWASVYTFGCRRMGSFCHGRVLFAGDAAHGVSPFGARGANSGVQDAENLAWKLAAVLQGEAGEGADALIASYGAEREYAADENILHSTRATDFITPKSAVSRLFRDAVLQLARTQPFARKLVNSGRLSVPATLDGSSLNTPDVDTFAGAMRPGAVAADAPLPEGRWLLRGLGSGFTLLVFGSVPGWARDLPDLGLLAVPAGEATALAWQRYDATPGSAYLIRPDQHVCARWRAPTAAAVLAARARALGRMVDPQTERSAA
ncbi:FAD-dependent oxidoreductase [Aquincola sp. J276]|uniref:FAD-dependent oxidoreductase n=1 Tax=Aquincola sp. J276 TaxID=2898432 RepID=UPI002151184B|nr:FAD-dependent oxidoreductase [Aquincola sp. J276]MCR5863908.1 FAD-dependent oxidoreductase [Aquincola sp. J276]